MDTKLSDYIYAYNPSADDPADLHDIVYGDPSSQRKIEHLLSEGSSPDYFYGRKNSLLLYGPPGTGKTTLAHLLLDELTDSDFATSTLNCPTGRDGIRFVKLLREIAKNNWEGFGFDHNYFLLNEVDQLSKTALKELSNVLEYPKPRFILTTNNRDELAWLPRLIDRCEEIPMPAASVEQLLPFAKQVLSGIKCVSPTPEGTLRNLVSRADGSFRKIRSLINEDVLERNALMQKAKVAA